VETQWQGSYKGSRVVSYQILFAPSGFGVDFKAGNISLNNWVMGELVRTAEWFRSDLPVFKK
jgi:hypothetical protein